MLLLTEDLNETLTYSASLPPLAPPSPLLTDAGLAPLVNRLGLMPVYRLYLIAQQINRDELDGRGWITPADLWQALPRFGVHYTRRQFDSLIKEESSKIFWRLRENDEWKSSEKSSANSSQIRLYLAGYIRVWERLGKRLYRTTPDVVLLDSYRPVNHPVWVEASGTLQAFKSRLYAAWLETRTQSGTKSGTFRASRMFIGQVWGACPNTLRQWEALTGIEITPVHAQYGGDNPKFRVPDHAYLYARKDGGVAAAWQLPNQYSVPEPQQVERHPHIGQNRKARKAHNRVIRASSASSQSRPLEPCGEGENMDLTGRLYFEHQKHQKHKNAYETFKAVRQALRRRSLDGQDIFARNYYVHLGEKSTRRGRVQLFECYDLQTDLPHTDLDERDYPGEQTREFRLLNTAAQEIGLTRALRRMHWKKTAPTMVVKAFIPLPISVQEVSRAQVQSELPFNPVDFDLLLLLGKSLGAEIVDRTRKEAHELYQRQQRDRVRVHLLWISLRRKIYNFRCTTSFPKKLVRELQAQYEAAGKDLTRLEALDTRIKEIKAKRAAQAKRWMQ